MRLARNALIAAAAIAWTAPGSHLLAQTTGQIIGRIVETGTGAPIASADVLLIGTEIRTASSDRGRFILAGVPGGTYALRVERLGFAPVILEGIQVRAGRTIEVRVSMTAAPVELEAIQAEIERVPLIELDVSATHEVVPGRELRELPVDEVAEAIELATGVSGGHFRGGRIGQETYRIDGLEVKNPFDASTRGTVLELPPTALEEIEVITGGFSADGGSALSGVVSYVTRRGDPDRWEGRASLKTDGWAPEDVFRGFNALSVSSGGPVPWLGEGATLFADLLVQGMIDTEPRGRGLTCLRPADADEEIAGFIESLESDPDTRTLSCPFTGSRIPYQRGDKLIGFLRFDRALTPTTALTISALHNRHQQELYTPEFKYNPMHQLGQRTRGTLVNLTLDWTRHARGRAYRLIGRGAALRLDRFLGALDPWTFEGRARIGGFGPADFRFLGEDFVKRPIEEQLARGTGVPGYEEPGGSTGSPFGPAAEGIFFTTGAPPLVRWSRTEFIGGDLIGEIRAAEGHVLRLGASGRLYRTESYERTLPFLPGSVASYARFYPVTASAFAQLALAAADEVWVDLGVRMEMFRSGLRVQDDLTDFLGSLADTEWKTLLLPKIGMAVPVPGSDGRTMFRFNYGLVSQPPDFQFFLGTAIGDSLRLDVRRQGNPDLGFERGSSYEIGLSHLVSPDVSISAILFLKELHNLVTGSLSFTGFADRQFTTGDFGSVRGLELIARAHWRGMLVRAGYALQSARGVTSGPLDQPADSGAQQRREFPLEFDRRHTADLTVIAGRPAGVRDSRWSAALTASIRSGYPLDRRLAAGDTVGLTTIPDRLPWTWSVNLRVGRELGAPPGCGRCRWRAFFEGRNLLGRENVIALRRDTGRLAPPASQVMDAAAEVPDDMEPIPLESPRYSPAIDLDRDGLIRAQEFRTARMAAVLDRNDPSLFFGAARELRLGMEVVF